MTKTVEERYDLGVEALRHLEKAYKALTDAGLYYGGIQKPALDLVTYLSANLFILDPERSQQIADENAAKYAESVKAIKDVEGFVAEDRPGSGMYSGYL